MRELLMLKGAKTLVDVCTKTKPGENVLIVTDMANTSIAKTIATVALDRGAETIMMVMKPRKRAGQEPPKPVADAMKSADVVFIPVSYSITHTHAVKEAAEAGSRLIVMTDFTEEMMAHGGIEADFNQIKPICRGVAKKFKQGRKIHLTSPGGTDLSMDISGRRGNALYCVVEPGEFSTVPTVEANVSPLEGTANGQIVADASIPYLGIGVLDAPITVTVKDGLITNIEGGRQADILKMNLIEQKDPNVYNIAEIGVGLNPKCRMCGIMLEDEGVISTCHIGIGTSITLGGAVKAAVHYDLLMWAPKIVVDGTVVLDREDVFI
ncbi:MAG: leucyl aminopeptidase [Desulfobacterales bacterium]|nr:leucyl aminopeptidase [Deltaproteobacteria bacterium]MBT8360936.1 leucyl aminopeptidase [Deltaproteobacteria bacterium]NNK95771.1 leucyl aminopeptidase [Desulfobacterales bacterium]